MRSGADVGRDRAAGRDVRDAKCNRMASLERCACQTRNHRAFLLSAASEPAPAASISAPAAALGRLRDLLAEGCSGTPDEREPLAIRRPGRARVVIDAWGYVEDLSRANVIHANQRVVAAVAHEGDP